MYTQAFKYIFTVHLTREYDDVQGGSNMTGTGCV